VGADFVAVVVFAAVAGAGVDAEAEAGAAAGGAVDAADVWPLEAF
jgi:hypothetical protein